MNTPKFRNRFDEFPSYMGGHTVLNNGYVFELVPHHRLANAWGFVAQHRLVGEQVAGRPLVRAGGPTERECVHHKNENKLDNRPENLEVMTLSAHRSLHASRIEAKKRARLNTPRVRVELERAGGIFAAATALGVHHQTLRNRFPELVEPYLRSSPVDLQNTEHAEQVREVVRHFAPTSMSYGELAKLTHICAKTLAAVCAEQGLAWNQGRGGAPGKKRMTYRGRPTRWALEHGGSPTESA